MRHLALRILASLAIIAVMFATVEGGLRGLAIIKHYLDDRYRAPDQTRYLDHPYFTAVLKPNLIERSSGYPGNNGGMSDFRTNSLGFRSAEFARQKSPGVYRIVVVGGSAAVTGSDAARTIPGLLMARLNDRAMPGRRYEVINAGMPGFTSRQELFLVATEVVRWQPDMVIVYDGRNDMFFGSMPAYRPNWVPRDEEMMLFLQRPAWMDDPWEQHVFTYHLYRTHVRGRQVQALPVGAYNLPAGRQFHYTPHPAAVDIYRENLRSLVALLIDRGIVPVLIYQPTLLSKVSRSAVEDVIFSSLAPRYVSAMLSLLPRGAEAMAEVARLHHLIWGDFTHLFDGISETLFVDDVHQTDRGNVLIADRLLALIGPLLPLSVHGDRTTTHRTGRDHR